MPVLVPTPQELQAMPAAKRDEWLARMPVHEVPVGVPVPFPVVTKSVRTRGVVVDVVRHRRYRACDADVVRCPLCGAWTLGVCRTGHVAS